MRIATVDTIVLQGGSAGPDSADFTGEALVLRIRTDDGLVGLAECNHPPAAVSALLHAAGSSSWSVGIEDFLVGRDPLDEAVLASLERASILSSRRGLGAALLHAVDVALWDIRARARGEPLWRTLWGDRAEPPRAYATVYTGGGAYDWAVERMVELVRGTRAAGFDAVKVEPLADCVPAERIKDFVSRAREAAGSDAELHVDFGYRFADAGEAAASILPLLELEPGFVETPLPADDPDEYARLAELVPRPLAASELFESEWEHVALLRHGALAIAQPWPNRVGVTGTLRVAEEARRLGRRTILAGWNATAVGEAASVHLAAGLGPGLALEHAPAEAYGEGAFRLRSVAGPEPVRDGATFRLPDAPGLGVELDA